MKLFLIIVFCVTLAPLYSQTRAYALLDAEGKETAYEKMLEKIKTADIIFLGEYHDQPLSHWLQKMILKDLHSQSGKQLVCGAEMFETDNQLLINEYWSGLITQKKFEDEARLWKNYKTDYKDFLEYCKSNQIPFIATNVPGRYANAVYNQGPEALLKLGNDARAFLPSYPIHFDMEVNCYKRMISEMGGHGGSNIAYAQALRDATMADRILANYKKGQLFLHLNGAYHSDFHEGIVYYLKRSNPSLNVIVLTTVYDKETNKLSEENKGRADFFLSINPEMNKSY